VLVYRSSICFSHQSKKLGQPILRERPARRRSAQLEGRKMAAEIKDPSYKKQMEVMAEIWEVLVLELSKSESISR
jgi:hypothetical protein